MTNNVIDDAQECEWAGGRTLCEELLQGAMPAFDAPWGLMGLRARQDLCGDLSR
jgi:hypothetical protein